MEWLSDPNVWIALLTLSALEIVLGIDNIIFIAILSGKLPQNQQARARTMGLLVAMISRIALLFSITLIMKLTRPLITILSFDISGRDIILVLGGLFLVGKATQEIHEKGLLIAEAYPTHIEMPYTASLDRIQSCVEGS